MSARGERAGGKAGGSRGSNEEHAKRSDATRRVVPCTLGRFSSSVSTSGRSRPDVTSRLTRSARWFATRFERQTVGQTDPFRASYSRKLHFSSSSSSSFSSFFFLVILFIFLVSFPPFLPCNNNRVCLSTTTVLFDKTIQTFFSSFLFLLRDPYKIFDIGILRGRYVAIVKYAAD